MNQAVIFKKETEGFRYLFYITCTYMQKVVEKIKELHDGTEDRDFLYTVYT
jgi:hypothetical protein